MMSAFGVFALAALLLLSHSAHAQQLEAALAPGTRIRLRVQGSAPSVW